MAGDGAALDLLKCEFPELESVCFRSRVSIRYSLHLPAWLKISFLSPLLFLEVFGEHIRMGRIVSRVRPDVVISDNRYGAWSRKTQNILITHQLSIRFPRFVRILEYPASRVLNLLIRRFDRCWIPDYPGGLNLSGALSHRFKKPRNAVFIGALSRFDRYGPVPGMLGKKKAATGDSIDLVVILSGPEPQRSQFQKIVLKQVLSLKNKCVILQGIPGGSRRTDITSTVTMYSHLSAWELKRLLLRSKYVICRSGYSGIMDLACLRKKALIIPTPGQTEQEYLAEYLSAKGMFLSCNQDRFEIVSALQELDDFEPLFDLPGEDLLGPELSRFG